MPSEQAPSSLAIANIDIIRIETAMSRYPIHRMANKGTVSIDIRRKDANGATALLWSVDYGNRHGQPGPLAYKLDTLVINRRIDEAGRPVPKVLRLGSLHEIGRELDLDRNTTAVRKALLQNVSAIINAKITYNAVDRTERTLESAFSRYSVVFTGEQLPNGRKADCVYLILNDLYLDVLNAAIRRPQDYEYLRSLPPAAQRFYEIVSYEMLPAIRYSQRAKLPYSEFCLYSTMTRYYDFDQVKKQMYKVHLPHVRAGYLAKVEYEATVDEEGRPDWNMFYLPGETARRQQLVFEFGLPNRRQKRAPACEPVLQPPTPASAPARLSPSSLPSADKEAEGVARAVGLVRTFYRLRYGREQEPTEREVSEARQFLAETPGWADHLVDHAARQGREKNAFPNDFGGVKKLECQARASFEAKRGQEAQARIRNVRRSHREAYAAAYRAFLGTLLDGRLKSSLPEAFSAFISEELASLRFHQARAKKSAVSARIVESYHAEASRIQRLSKFIEENPKSGLPDFWQWDAEFNTSSFRLES